MKEIGNPQTSKIIQRLLQGRTITWTEAFAIQIHVDAATFQDQLQQ